MRMDIHDQLGALRKGRRRRRAVIRSLASVGIVAVMVPLIPRRLPAAPEDHATWFTWGGFDVPDDFDRHVAKRGELPRFATYGSAEEALTRLKSGFVADVVMPCLSDVPRRADTGLFRPIDPARLSNRPDVLPEPWDVDDNRTGEKVWMMPREWGQTSVAYRTGLRDPEGAKESWDMP